MSRRQPRSSAPRGGGARGSAGNGRLIGLGLRRGSAQREFVEHCNAVTELYENSGIQTVAVGAYQNAINSTGLRFSKSKEPARGMVTTAINDIVKNLCIYGYSCYRIIPTTARVGVDEIPVQVPSGCQMAVRFSGNRARWVPDVARGNVAESVLPDLGPTYTDGYNSDDTDDDEDEEGSWQCIVVNPPTETRLTSYAAQSYNDAVRIERILKNVETRDSFNSTPHCYTTINEQELTAKGRAGGQVFLKSGLDIDPHTGEEGMTRGLDYKELLASRAAVLRGLAENTDRSHRASAIADGAYANTGTGLRGNTFLPDESDTGHKELCITDGRRATPVAPLHSPENIVQLITRLRLNVLQSFGCSPQWVGESVSAERVGSNAQSTSNSMRIFELRAAMLRDMLPVAKFGLEWMYRPAVNVLERVFPLLKTEQAVDMVASVYRIDAASIDPDRIKRQQDAMLGDKGGTTAPANAPEQLKTEKRRRKTEVEKEVTDLNKGSAF